MIAPPVIWYGLSCRHYFIILFIIVVVTIWDTFLYTYSQRVAITFLISVRCVYQKKKKKKKSVLFNSY